MSRLTRFFRLSHQRANAPISQTHPAYLGLLGAATAAIGWAVAGDERALLVTMGAMAGLFAFLGWVWNFYKSAWDDSGEAD